MVVLVKQKQQVLRGCLGVDDNDYYYNNENDYGREIL